jgi:hypothetical protein
MEQLVWAIIIIVFIIYTALKNRARSRNIPDTNIDRTADTEQKKGETGDRLGRYMEDLLGIERAAVTKPQIEIERKTQKPLRQKVTTREELEAEEKVDLVTSPLVEKLGPLPSKEREASQANFPWGTLSRKGIRSAIILSEIIGPPIAKRKSHRLF